MIESWRNQRSVKNWGRRREDAFESRFRKKLYFRHFEKSPISTSISFVIFFFSLSSKVTINDSSFEISRGAGGWEIRIAASARQVAVLLLQIIVLSLRITQIFAHPVNIDNLC